MFERKFFKNLKKVIVKIGNISSKTVQQTHPQKSFQIKSK